MNTLLAILLLWFLASIVVGFAAAQFIAAGERHDDFARFLANPKDDDQ